MFEWVRARQQKAACSRHSAAAKEVVSDSQSHWIQKHATQLKTDPAFPPEMLLVPSTPVVYPSLRTFLGQASFLLPLIITFLEASTNVVWSWRCLHRSKASAGAVSIRSTVSSLLGCFGSINWRACWVLLPSINACASNKQRCGRAWRSISLH